MRRISRPSGVAFAALTIPNYRRYVVGQAVSLTGTWMQMTAQAWLVYTLTHSSTALGLIVGAQTLPVLLLGPYGGVIADRVDKRRLMIVLQTTMGLQALVLGVLTITGSVRIWEIAGLAMLLGLNNAFENPARQSFMLEMVGAEHLRNAVSLNSVLVNVARSIGPAVAGVMIATLGDGVCFLANAVSFAAVVGSLVTMNASALHPSPAARRGPGQLREGLRYVARTPELAIPLGMMAVTGTLAYEFQVSLPVMAKEALNAGPTGFGFMTAAMGIGAIGGGLLVAARGHIGLPTLTLAAGAFAGTLLLAALAPNLPIELAALALAGWASVSFMSTANATLQLTADPAMRGRVMSLWFVAFQGSTPIGGADHRLGDERGGRTRRPGSRCARVPFRSAVGSDHAAAKLRTAQPSAGDRLSRSLTSCDGPRRSRRCHARQPHRRGARARGARRLRARPARRCRRSACRAPA